MRMKHVSVALLAALFLAAGCGGGSSSRELARTGLDLPSDLPEGSQGVIAADFVHEGEGSFHVFATERIKVPFMDCAVADVVGDSLTVTLWARTEIMQRAVRLEMYVEGEEGDPRIAQQVMPDVRRTLEWTRFAFAFPVPDGESPRRVRLSVLIPEPGKLWLDDVAIWDGAPPETD